LDRCGEFSLSFAVKGFLNGNNFEIHQEYGRFLVQERPEIRILHKLSTEWATPGAKAQVLLDASNPSQLPARLRFGLSSGWPITPHEIALGAAEQVTRTLIFRVPRDVPEGIHDMTLTAWIEGGPGRVTPGSLPLTLEVLLWPEALWKRWSHVFLSFVVPSIFILVTFCALILLRHTRRAPAQHLKGVILYGRVGDENLTGKLRLDSLRKDKITVRIGGKNSRRVDLHLQRAGLPVDIIIFKEAGVARGFGRLWKPGGTSYEASRQVALMEGPGILDIRGRPKRNHFLEHEDTFRCCGYQFRFLES